MAFSTTSSALVAKVLAKPLIDIYEVGKDKFRSELEKLRNESMRKSLAVKIVNVQKVKSFWQRDKEVSLSSFYYPSNISFPASGRKKADSLAAFPSLGNFVIQGTIGQGKSIFLRYLCLQELRGNGSGRIPIFVELRSVTTNGIKSMVFNAFERLGFSINEHLFDFYASTGKIVLLLDAFDELDDNLVKSTITELETFAEKYPTLQMFVTSRRHSSIQGSRLFRVAHLAPLTRNDHEPFLKRLGLEGKELHHILNAIKSSPSRISELLTTPLMLTLLVIVYRSENTIPQELPEFYEKLFETLFSKHDHSKPGYIRKHQSGLGERQLQHLFEAFCFSSIQLRHTTRLTTNGLHEAFEKAQKQVNIPCDADGFRQDITRVTCLMQEEGFDLVFIHKSVVEFFAASFVRSRNDDTARRFYEQLIDKNWGTWRQVLVFLSQVDRYRYAKYYAVPAATLSSEILEIDPNATSVSDSYALSKRIYDGVVVLLESFSRDEEEEQSLYFSGFEGFHDPTLQLSDITDTILESDITEDLTTADAISQYPSATVSRDGRETTIRIPWNDYFSSEQLHLVANETKMAVLRMLDQRREWIKYIAAEEAKAPLIDL